MDYKNGKIYRIVCNVSGKQYVGSTVQLLSKRLWSHKDHYKKWKQGTFNYLKSFEIIENGDYNIILIEMYPCSSKYELERRERHWIDTLECVNKIRPAQTDEERDQYWKEYYNTNRDELLEKRKKYKEDNSEKVRQKDMEYKERNRGIREQKNDCQCGGKYTKSNQSIHFKSKKHQDWIKVN